MPNTPVRAAAEGLPRITRRSIVGGFVVASAVAAAEHLMPTEIPAVAGAELPTGKVNQMNMIAKPNEFEYQTDARHREMDHALLDLGRQLDEAWAAERAAYLAGAGDEAMEAAFSRSGYIVALIEVVPAVSIEGLRVKARAIDWCHCGEPDDAGTRSSTTDVRLAVQIVRALQTI